MLVGCNVISWKAIPAPAVVRLAELLTFICQHGGRRAPEVERGEFGELWIIFSARQMRSAAGRCGDIDGWGLPGAVAAVALRYGLLADVYRRGRAAAVGFGGALCSVGSRWGWARWPRLRLRGCMEGRRILKCCPSYICSRIEGRSMINVYIVMGNLRPELPR